MELERAGHGGNRLAAIEHEIDTEGKNRDQRQENDRRFAGQLAEAGLRPVASVEQFAARRSEIAAEFVTTEQVLAAREHGYDPMQTYYAEPILRQALDAIGSGLFSPDDPGRFRPIVDSLL